MCICIFQTTLWSFPTHGGYPQHRALGRALAIAPDLHFVAHAVDLRSLINLWEIYGKSMGTGGLGDGRFLGRRISPGIIWGYWIISE